MPWGRVESIRRHRGRLGRVGRSRGGRHRDARGSRKFARLPCWRLFVRSLPTPDVLYLCGRGERGRRSAHGPSATYAVLVRGDGVGEPIPSGCWLQRTFSGNLRKPQSQRGGHNLLAPQQPRQPARCGDDDGCGLGADAPRLNCDAAHGGLRCRGRHHRLRGARLRLAT
jgi:hypothetical protein